MVSFGVGAAYVQDGSRGFSRTAVVSYLVVF